MGLFENFRLGFRGFFNNYYLKIKKPPPTSVQENNRNYHLTTSSVLNKTQNIQNRKYQWSKTSKTITNKEEISSKKKQRHKEVSGKAQSILCRSTFFPLLIVDLNNFCVPFTISVLNSQDHRAVTGKHTV